MPDDKQPSQRRRQPDSNQAPAATGPAKVVAGTEVPLHELNRNAARAQPTMRRVLVPMQEPEPEGGQG